MKRYGLIGRPLGHSFSAGYFAAKFRREGITGCDYALYELPSIEALPELLGAQPELQGFNVTIPYKKAVIPYLAELSPTAKKLGAVNTIVRRKDGTLFGHNTDYFGFASLLKRSGLSVAGKKFLVLGSGGASNTVTAVLAELGAETVVISRSGENKIGRAHV